MTADPIRNRIKCHKVLHGPAPAVSASKAENAQGQNNNQVPIGRSARASLR
jgi:hypothetical protein